MRSICGGFAVVTILGLTTAAPATQPCCPNQPTGGYGAYEAYSAPACGAPSYGMVPGCCELPPSCCDHVWDGYCQELRGLDAVRAFFPRRGAWGYGRGAGLYRGGEGFGPVASGCHAVEQVPPSGDEMVEIPPAPTRSQ